MENPDQPEIKKLANSITVKVNGEDHEIFMSFALLNRLTIIIGDIEQVPMIQMNPEVREAFMKELLAKRSRSGKVIQAVEVEDCDITLEDVQFVLDFASAHIMDFMIGAIEKSGSLGMLNAQRMNTLASTLAGLANSASKNSAV